jgi:uncharacterized protein DUF3830
VRKRIVLEADGVAVEAELLEEGAPETCRRFWGALPLDETLRHVRWGGDAAYVLARSLRDPSFPYENRISFYTPATIAYKPEHGELAFAYGQAQARNPLGNGWATHFANLLGDSRAFLEVMRRTQREGAKRLTIRRRE